MITAIILMGGRSNRFGENKLTLIVDNKPVWRYSVDAFLSHPKIDSLVLVCRKKEIELTGFPKKICFAEPGTERMFSVYNGLVVAKQQFNPDYVLIHDGARPLVSKELIDRVISAVLKYQACVPAVEISSTVKQVDKTKNFVIKTLNRDFLVQVQTPQGFSFDKLFFAYKKAVRNQVVLSDDAGVWERFVDSPVFVCQGDRRNIKLTYKEDLFIVRSYLSFSVN